MASIESDSAVVDDIFSKLDTNQDGSISQSEYEAAVSKMRSHRPPPPPPLAQDNQVAMSIDDIFKTIDTNGDASISKDELASFLEQTSTNANAASAQGTDSSGSAVSSTDSQQSWMRRMLEKLLSAYGTATQSANAQTSGASVSNYA
jgi:Ca2+-binding EF-hand superfamily protein